MGDGRRRDGPASRAQCTFEDSSGAVTRLRASGGNSRHPARRTPTGGRLFSTPARTRTDRGATHSTGVTVRPWPPDPWTTKDGGAH